MIKSVLMLFTFVLVLPVYAEFQGKTFRYSTSYDSFDRVAYNHYGYSENFSSQNYCGGYHTCYHPSLRTERIYIEERIVDYRYVDNYNADTRITIYTDRHYSRPYVTYHTHRGRIVNRSYHHNNNYYGWHSGYNHHQDYYYGDYYNYHHHYYYEVDWSTPEGKIITGLHFMATGVEMIALCSDVDDEGLRAICMGFGFGLAASGSASSAHGIDQAIQESKLYKALERDAQIYAERDLDIE